MRTVLNRMKNQKFLIFTIFIFRVMVIAHYGHCMVYFMVIEHLSYLDGHFSGEGGGGSVLHILSWEISKNSKPELMRRQFVLRQLWCFPDPQLTPQSNQLSYQLKYEGTHRQIFSESYLIKPKSDCIYRFPINLEQNGSTFSSKSIGPW